MYLTHTFAHRETLSRAYSWLTHLGFHPRRIEAPDVSISRLMIPLEPDRLAAAQMVINAVESADADGFPSFWDDARIYHGHPADGDFHHPHQLSMAEVKPGSSEIGWHPID